MADEYLDKLFEAKQRVHRAGQCADDWPDDAVFAYDTLLTRVNHAELCVDRVFQEGWNPHAADEPPVLPDFCRPGEDKFEAVISLARRYAELRNLLYDNNPPLITQRLDSVIELEERHNLPYGSLTRETLERSRGYISRVIEAMREAAIDPLSYMTLPGVRVDPQAGNINRDPETDDTQPTDPPVEA